MNSNEKLKELYIDENIDIYSVPIDIYSSMLSMSMLENLRMWHNSCFTENYKEYIEPVNAYINILELMRHHGKDLEFVGMTIANNVMKIDGKDTMGMMAATLCKQTLNADCVIVNKSGMGHCQLDAAYAFNWAEKMGMPAVVSLNAVSNDKPGDMLVISDPKIDAVVNSGRNYMLEHPRVDRLIGENTNVPSLAGIDPWGPFTHTTNYAYMGIWSQIGDFCATCDTDLQDAPETF